MNDVKLDTSKTDEASFSVVLTCWILVNKGKSEEKGSLGVGGEFSDGP